MELSQIDFFHRVKRSLKYADKEEYDRGYTIGIKSSCSQNQAYRRGYYYQKYNFKKCEIEVWPVVLQSYFDGKENRIRDENTELKKQFIKINQLALKIEQSIIRDSPDNLLLIEEIRRLKKEIDRQSHAFTRNYPF